MLWTFDLSAVVRDWVALDKSSLRQARKRHHPAGPEQAAIRAWEIHCSLLVWPASLSAGFTQRTACSQGIPAL